MQRYENWVYENSEANVQANEHHKIIVQDLIAMLLKYYRSYASLSGIMQCLFFANEIVPKILF
jgi:hypothetical protein